MLAINDTIIVFGGDVIVLLLSRFVTRSVASLLFGKTTYISNYCFMSYLFGYIGVGVNKDLLDSTIAELSMACCCNKKTLIKRYHIFITIPLSALQLLLSVGCSLLLVAFSTLVLRISILIIRCTFAAAAVLY